MSNTSGQKELELFQTMAAGLGLFDKDTQARILQAVITFLKLEGLHPRTSSSTPITPSGAIGAAPAHSFTSTETVSPKEFLLEKAPRTDIERIACLAYYITHYRETPHFRTLDLSKLNTEAAQQKFTNPAQAAKNATNRGLIVPVSRGKKQLSAMGEQFVRALPERDEAIQVLQRLRPKKKGKRNATGKRKAAPKSIRTERK